MLDLSIHRIGSRPCDVFVGLAVVLCNTAFGMDESALPNTTTQESVMTNNELLTKDVARILESADQAALREDWVEANALLKRGLEMLGSRYVSSGAIDETGMKLVLAEAEEKRGALDNAARMRRRILSERLTALQKKK